MNFGAKLLRVICSMHTQTYVQPIHILLSNSSDRMNGNIDIELTNNERIQ